MPNVDLQSLLEAHDQAFIVIDEDYRIVAANRRYCEAHHADLESVRGRRCHDGSHHSPRPCHENGEGCPHRTVSGAGLPGEVLHTHFDAGGHAARVRIRAHPIHCADGRLLLGEAIYPWTWNCRWGARTCAWSAVVPRF